MLSIEKWTNHEKVLVTIHLILRTKVMLEWDKPIIRASDNCIRQLTKTEFYFY